MECNSLPEFHRFEFFKKKKAFDSVCQGKFMADQKSYGIAVKNASLL